jgi:hypothetical protein
VAWRGVAWGGVGRAVLEADPLAVVVLATEATAVDAHAHTHGQGQGQATHGIATRLTRGDRPVAVSGGSGAESGVDVLAEAAPPVSERARAVAPLTWPSGPARPGC